MCIFIAFVLKKVSKFGAEMPPGHSIRQSGGGELGGGW